MSGLIIGIIIALLVAGAALLFWLALRPHHEKIIKQKPADAGTSATAQEANATVAARASSGVELKQPPPVQHDKHEKHDKHAHIDHDQSSGSLNDQAQVQANEVFNDEFREELKNRGRLHFEKIINENAMFLQQDLRLTTSQLNDYMKQEIKRTLQDEFSKYEQSIADAKQLAIESIEKTKQAIDQQRTILIDQLGKQVSIEKQRMLDRFEENLSDIVNHYLLQAVGNELDLSSQLEFIVGYLEENKQAIVEDIKNGA